MLVPGIHSDSKIKLQEEVCTRNNGFWASSEHLAFPFFFPWSSEFRVWRLVCVGFWESCLGFSLALRRSSPKLL